MLPLGFRFDVDAVVVGGIAHLSHCQYVVSARVEDATHVFAGSVHRAERCPQECPTCRPPFETMLTHQLERQADTPVL